MSSQPTIAIGREDEHFATVRKALGIQNIGLNTFPDPDIVLRRTGQGLRGLRQLLFDDQLETVWNARLSALTQSAWSLVGGNSRKDKEAHKFIADTVADYPLKTIMEGMLHAAAYGFSPLEIMWQAKNGRWIPEKLIPKPTEWFNFDSAGNLQFKTRWSVSGESVPDNKFLLVQHRASYDNPYGDKLFSKVYWPVTFKKNGMKWWLRFIEKFGSPALVGEYDQNNREKQREEMLQALDQMTAASVAAIPIESSIYALQDTDKRGSGEAHNAFTDFQNKAIAKVILGQTLTTETAANGNRSLGDVHQATKNAVTFADQDMVADAFYRLFRFTTTVNFGAEVTAPRLLFDRPANLKTDRAERDNKLYAVGVRFSKNYIARHYELEDDHFEIAQEEVNTKSFAGKIPKVTFASKKAESDMDEFIDSVGADGQVVLDNQVEKYVRDLEKSGSYKQAYKRIFKRFKKALNFRKKLTKLFANIRYAAHSIGDSDG